MTDTKQFSSIDEYIKSFPKDTQDILQEVRQTIFVAAPQATETINYNMPAFDLNGKHLVYFAAWKNHISLYPIPKADAAFQEELEPYKKGKGTLQFPLDMQIPYELIIQIVIFLTQEQ